MAKDTAKKANKSNEARLHLYIGITIALNVVYFLYRVMWHSDSFNWTNKFGLLFLIGGEVFTLRELWKLAMPETDSHGNIEACQDLSNLKGMASYYQDILWVSWFVHFTTLLSDWFWLFYLVIPAYAGYIAWIYVGQPYMASRVAQQQSGAKAKDGAVPRKDLLCVESSLLLMTKRAN